MTTADLVDRLVAATDGAPLSAAIDALHTLLDDSTIEPDARALPIADAARLVGMSAHTLRYYEGEGLVRPSRDSSGYRSYDAAALRRLVFLARMRLSGMTMQELKRYVALVEAGAATEPERREMMLAQRERIVRQQRELALALEATEFKIRVYGGHPTP